MTQTSAPLPDNWWTLQEQITEIVASSMQDVAAGDPLEESLSGCEREIRACQELFARSHGRSPEEFATQFALQIEQAKERVRSWEDG